MGDESNRKNDPPVEFYLDVATKATPTHLCFLEVADELRIMFDEYPTLKLVLMHYDNRELLKRQIEDLLPGMLGERIIVAYQSV